MKIPLLEVGGGLLFVTLGGEEVVGLLVGKAVSPVGLVMGSMSLLNTWKGQ